MDEKKWMDRIRNSGENVEIPECLEPDRIEEGLKQAEGRKGGRFVSLFAGDRRRLFRTAVSVAAAVALIGIGVLYAGSGFSDQKSSGGASAGGMTAKGSQEETGESKQDAVSSAGEAGQAGESGSGAGTTGQSGGNSAEGALPEVDPEAARVFAEQYHTVSSYRQLKSELSRYERQQKLEDIPDRVGGWLEGIFGGKSDAVAAEESGGTTSAPAAGETAADAAYASGGGYSRTNVQTAGVDEGDIVKTDGKYLYVLRGTQVKIFDIRSGEPAEAGEIRDTDAGGACTVHEMYVTGKVLQLVVSERSSELLSEEEAEDVYYVEEKERVRLITYDISDPSNPVKKGESAVDGTYQTSRRKGGYVYLLTDYYVDSGADEPGGMLPAANSEYAAEDSIYLPKKLENTHCIVIAAVDTKKPDEVCDLKTVFTGWSEVYVSNTAIYLRRTSYESAVTTFLTQFRFQNGQISPGGAATVAGEIRDTFAINEFDKTLRVLTSVNDETLMNQITVFDAETMALLGKKDGIADGEYIYSARFMGNYGYFVTYQNMDPLFAVDFSDPADPQIISELKVTGFSDYLHFWGSDKLLGIGYETDPDSGERKGVKLSMFDISDPHNLREVGKLVLKAEYTAASEIYKTVLADYGRDLIGLTVVNSWSPYQLQYLLLAYNQEGAFQSLITEPLNDDSWDNGVDVRSLYAGDYLYLVSSNTIFTYDLKDDCARVSQTSY